MNNISGKVSLPFFFYYNVCIGCTCGTGNITFTYFDSYTHESYFLGDIILMNFCITVSYNTLLVCISWQFSTLVARPLHLSLVFNMSLPNLAKYMNAKYNWRKLDLQGKNVVIKGDSLCYHLYFKNHMWQCGGHYYEFYSTVREFFAILDRLRVSAYVVMNGALTNEETYKERCVDRLGHITSIRTSRTSSVHTCVLPLFAKTVFIDAMRDLKVDFIIADGDGDPICVSLANGLEDCPVLGDDADFFIFNIEGGYVPLYDERGSLIDFSRKVSCYNYRAFDAEAGMISHDQRLYLPLLISKPGARNSIESLLETIQSERQYSGYERMEVVYGMEKQMVPIRSFYRAQSLAKTFDELDQHTRLTVINPRISKWMITTYKRGGFMHAMMQFLVCKLWRYSNVIEDTSKSSAWSVTVNPRRYIMGALAKLLEDRNGLTNTDRTGIPCFLQETKVELKDKHCQLLGFPLKEIPDRDIVERQKILLRAFNCKHIQLSLGKVSSELRLAVVACRAWLKTDEEKFEPLLTPLVLCILSCSGLLPMPNVLHGNTIEEPDALNRLHSLAQWQCMLHHVIAFNQLLGNVFPYTSPAKLFSCSVVDHFVRHPAVLPMEKQPFVMIDVITKK